jgi:predicted 3-demethylubiquinone-9 3-methyltransferase (glyoxalase superfamily)
MSTITPFLWFDTQAEEAASFYVSLFSKGGRKNSKVLSVARYGDAGPGPKGTAMTVSFKLDGQVFTGLNGGPQFKFNESVSFVIDCKTQKEIDYFWEKLTQDGGQESMCGWLKDKYGLSWQVFPASSATKLFDSKKPERAKRVMEAMLKMKKIDIKALKDAAKK